MSKRPEKAPSQRQLRVGEEIRHALADSLEKGEVRDPGLGARPITVTEVRVSPDLRHATAFVMPLGGAAAPEVDKVVQALSRAAPFLKHRVAERVRLKFAPDLVFRADETFAQAERIETLLSDPRVERDIHPRVERDIKAGGNKSREP